MRQRRLKLSPAVDEAMYHCRNRVINREWLLNDAAKETLRREIRMVADYCGVEVVTHSVMSNHFHVTARVPRSSPVSDAELLRRYRLLYGKPTKRNLSRLARIEALLAANGQAAVQWREQQLRQMGDISQYMKLLKQRFSVWFNKTHNRVGPLWSERFKSTLIGPGAWQTVAAYNDLNPVRAGIVTDPKDYRYCGYAEAVAGDPAAQEGIRSVVGGKDWAEAQAVYRQVLFGTAGAPREGAASIPQVNVDRVLAEGGQLPLATVLLCQIRYFTEGVAIGSQAFVEAQLAAYRKLNNRRGGSQPQALPPCTDWGGTVALRKVRGRAIG